MHADSWKVAHAMLVDCCHALFETVGVRLSLFDGARSDSPEERLTTFIGFSGDDLRGSITMDLPIGLVARVHPAASAQAHIGNAEMCDWAGELANQLLGRFKNAIGRHNVLLQMSTPSTVWGRMSHAPKARDAGAVELCFATGSERLIIYFDALARAEMNLMAPAAMSESEPQAEGAVLFF